MRIINSNSELLEEVKHLKNENIIGIDTEFVRQKTYYAKLCLVQVATPRSYYLIDPLKVDMLPFSEILASENIIKIFHAPQQDLQIFYHDLGVITKNVFDTQIAARLSNIRPQISYRELCSRALGLEIIKNQGFRDWSIRPLPTEMENYAAQDVKYLIQLYFKLRDSLLRTSMSGEFKKIMSEFSSKEFYKSSADDAWKKISFYSKSSSFVEKIKIIACFREEIAMILDVPKKNVLSDNDVIKICSRLPKTKKDIDYLNLSKKIDERFIGKLLDYCAGLE
jgi:ribonuclease D